MIGEAENTLRALMARYLTGTGLTYHTWVLLNATATGGGQADRRPLTAIAVNGMKIDEAAVDAAFATLADSGLVTVTADHIRLTDAGSRLHQRVNATMGPTSAGLLRDLPDDDLAAAARVLTTITARANGILAAGADG